MIETQFEKFLDGFTKKTEWNEKNWTPRYPLVFDDGSALESMIS
jgi:hypothetical protein